MKTTQRLSAFFLMLLCCASTLLAQSYRQLWNQVAQAEEKSLPQTALKLSDDIYRKALEEKNVPQLLKAYLARASYQEHLTPDSLYANFTHLELWAEKEQHPLNKSILHSLLAREYADLMSRNRGALLMRTDLDVEEVPADVREWGLSQFVERIDSHALASVKPVEALLEVSSKAYLPLVEPEADSEYFEHDMYHILVRRAIDAYQEWDGFQLDSLMKARISMLYEEAVAVYQQRHEPDAELLFTLHYMDWAQEENISVSIESECMQMLDSLMDRFGERPLAAEICLRKARCLHRQKRTAEALRLCEEGMKQYSSYKRVNALKNLRAQILQPQLSIRMAESAYPGDSLALMVNYRNLSGFSLQWYSTDFKEIPYLEDGITKSVYQRHAHLLRSTRMALKPLSKPDVAREDWAYQACDTLLRVVAPEQPGVYLLKLIPPAGTTKSSDHFLAITRFKSLTLAMPGGETEIVVLDSKSGQPIADASIAIYDNNYLKNRKLIRELKTDSYGKVLLNPDKTMRSYVVRRGDDGAMPPQQFYSAGRYGYSAGKPQSPLTLLTDRSLYRPGQTVYIKGVAFEQYPDSAHVLEGKEYEVRLLDVNRKEVAKQSVCTNEFGSFTVELVLPTATLNGSFRIEAGGNSTTIRVEEYKRPSFELTFDPLLQAYTWGDTVQLSGQVKSFTGVPVQELPLTYTVVHQEPRYLYGAGATPLLADTIRLDAEGRFILPVVLRPESDGKANRFSTFRVEATVTNEAGETQTASMELHITPRPFLFRSDLAENICKEDSLEAYFEVRNAINNLLPVKGIVRLYPFVDTSRLGGGVWKKDEMPDSFGAPLYEGTFVSGQKSDLSAWRHLPSGKYRVVLSVKDRRGKEWSNADEGGQEIMLFSGQDSRLPAFKHSFLYEKTMVFDEENDASFYYGTSHCDTYVLFDLFDEKGCRLESSTMQLSDTLLHLTLPYKQAYGRGISLLLTFVKDDEMYSHRVEILKRQPARALDVKWEVFRDKLRPGQQEEWKMVLKTPQGIPAAAEVLATLYDASLDKIYRRPQSLRGMYGVHIPYIGRSESRFHIAYYPFYFPMNYKRVTSWLFGHFYTPRRYAVKELSEVRYASATANRMMLKFSSPQAPVADMVFDEEVVQETSVTEGGVLIEDDSADASEEIPLRTDFAETAFFYPQLRTNEQGEILFSFTMPESLTRWNFRSYAHTREMLTGQLDAEVITAKEFMLTPNLPRFVRLNDRMEFSATLANQTEKEIKGTATLTLFDPLTDRPLLKKRQNFTVKSGRSTVFSFAVDLGKLSSSLLRTSLLGVRLVADGGSFSDGEQHLLPVLSDKEYITETLPITIRGKEKQTFRLDSLFNRDSPTATNRRLTVEFTGNPAWYAVQALPALTQPDTDNALAWAVAHYANTLASYIAHAHPRIHTVLQAWQTSADQQETLLSRLEQNQELKQLLIAESPWLLDATTDNERMARLVRLFDVNRMHDMERSALVKLQTLQREDGSWSWYKGMAGSRYITAYLAELMARLSLLTKQPLSADWQQIYRKAMEYLHAEAQKEYAELRKAEQQGEKITALSGAALDYLYLIALSGEQVPASAKAAHAYFLSKIGANLKHGNILVKARSAVILHRASRMDQAEELLASIREHLIQEEELGAHFAFLDTPYRWGMMPIPTHVAAMEALSLTPGNEKLVEEMKLWLLKQKQTTSWNSAVSTADAVYALLCRGGDELSHEGKLFFQLGKNSFPTGESSSAVAGLNYIKESFEEGSPEMKAQTITVEKPDEGVAWGAVYAQYLSPLSDVRQQGREMSIEKNLFVERLTANGKKLLQPIGRETPLQVGDKVTVRLTLRLDRAMDFVQLKDGSAACLEPLSSLSGYRWSNGLGYYVEVEDAAVNFFFDRLGKGVYVLEHSFRVARAGTYKVAFATIRSAYAPEFAAHSSAPTLVVSPKSSTFAP